MPVPRQLVPGRGTKLRKGRQHRAPAGRKLPPVLIRKNGCHPSRVIRRNSHGAYKPRSANTITVQPRGMARCSRRNSRSHSRRQACLAPAGRITQATGMAQPRYTTQKAKTVACGLLRWDRCCIIVVSHWSKPAWQNMASLLSSCGFWHFPQYAKGGKPCHFFEKPPLVRGGWWG